MSRVSNVFALMGAIAAAWFLTRPRTADTAAGEGSLLTAGVDAVTAALAGWKNAGQGPKWVPFLNAAELQYGIPTDLLAAIAYRESRFRQDIIDGTTASSAGALGLMQLEPQYFASVQVPRPFTDDDTLAQIQQAAQALVEDYKTLGNWQLSVAAYNAGLHAVQKAGGVPPFKETLAYVAEVTANVPEIASA